MTKNNRTIKKVSIFAMAALTSVAVWQISPSSKTDEAPSPNATQDLSGLTFSENAIAADEMPKLLPNGIQQLRLSTHEQTGTALSILEQDSEIAFRPVDKTNVMDVFAATQLQMRPLTAEQSAMHFNQGAHFFAANASQQLTARFLDKGVRLQSGQPGKSWAGELTLANGEGPVEIRQLGARVEYAHENILEWYVNRDAGIQHGFIVEQRPSWAKENTLSLIVDSQGLEVRRHGEADLKFVDEAGNDVMAYLDLKAWDANGLELEAMMSPTEDGFQISVADSQATYPVTIDPLIVTLEAILGPEGLNEIASGASLSLDGNTAVVGSPLDSSTGSVHVFVRSGTTWSLEASLFASDANPGAEFGSTVSLNGNRLLVGAPFSQSSTGAVYVFERNGTNWLQTALLVTPPDSGYTDQNIYPGFGRSVSLDGNTAVISSANTPRVHVLEFDGVNWNQEAFFEGGTSFGFSVSLDGDTFAVGEYVFDFFVGRAFIYEKINGTWQETAELFANGQPNNGRFGFDVSLSGNSVLIGAINGNSFNGDAYVFVKNGSNWVEQAVLPTTGSTDVARSVSLQGNTALVTANERCLVFERTGSTWSAGNHIEDTAGQTIFFSSVVSLDGNTAIISDYGIPAFSSTPVGRSYAYTLSGANWTQESALPVFSGPAESGNFGASVAVDGNTNLIGAPLEDTFSGEDIGAAYFFVKSNDTWSLEQRVEASNGLPEDEFGAAVAIDGNNAVVTSARGAYIFSRSQSTWTEDTILNIGSNVQNIRNGTSASFEGNTVVVGTEWLNAVYVYVNTGGSWTLQAQLDGLNSQPFDFFGASVSLDADTLLVGATGVDAASGGDAEGATYVYVRNGANWLVETTLKASDAAPNSFFGSSVSLDGDIAIVGAENADLGTGGFTNEGKAYIFVRNGTTWTEQAILSPSDALADDRFGTSVSIKDGVAIVGAAGDDEGIANAGSVYVYVFDGNNWVEQEKLTQTNPVGRSFGNSVSYDGETIAVGVPLTTVNGVINQGEAYVYNAPEPNDPPPLDVIDFQFNTTGPGSTEGWVANDHIAAFITTGTEFLVRASTGNDPFITRHDLAVPGSNTPQIRVRFKSQEAGMVELFWATAQTPGFSPSRRKAISYTNRNNFVELVFDMQGDVNWDGQTITSLRFDIPRSNSVERHSWFDYIIGPNQVFVSMRKRNAIGFAIDGGVGGANGQNVKLWAFNPANINQQWEEISRGGGFYSYRKRETNFAIDGGGGGNLDQNVKLWAINANNQNQHWKKIDLGGGYYRLEKRNAPAYSIDGGNGGSNDQNVKLWTNNNNNQNQNWLIE